MHAMIAKKNRQKNNLDMPEMTGENISQNQTKDNDVNMSVRNI